MNRPGEEIDISRKGQVAWTVCKYYLTWWVWVAPSYWINQRDVEGATLFPLLLLVASCVTTYVLLTSRYRGAARGVEAATSYSKARSHVKSTVTFLGCAVAYIAASASGFVILDAIYPQDPIDQLTFEYHREAITGACIMVFSVFLGQGAFAHFLMKRAD